MTKKTEWKVTGMTCDSCANSVRIFLQKEGMENIYVSFSDNHVSFDNIPNTEPEKIVKGIRSLGYKVIFNSEKEGSWFDSPTHKFWASLPFTALLMLHMLWDYPLLHKPWFQCLLSTPVFLLGWQQYGRSAISSLLRKSPNMDVLILTGASAAFIYSILGWILYQNQHQFLFFETTASIITLVLLGATIEKRAVAKTTTDLKSLSALQPQKAQKIIFNLLTGKEETIEVEASTLLTGEKVRVNTGEIIPIDGRVLQGHAAVQQASLTGESQPAGKQIHDDVFAGTMVVDGSLVIEASSPGNKTLLSDIIQMVKKARDEKPAIQKLGDKISAIFVPLVVLISLLTYFINVWLGQSMDVAMMRAIAVLVISCPCAMGLATPLAVVVGLGKAARQGIIIKGADTLEKLNSIKTLVFDKTGTLTTGNLKVEDFTVFDFKERDAKNIIYHFEQHSNHPIARSIIAEHQDWNHHNLGFEEIKELKGMGIKAKDFFGNIYTLGSIRLVEELKADKKEFDIYLTLNNKIVAAFNLNDELRPEAQESLKSLQSYHTVLLSGDSKRKCKQTGELLQIQKVFYRQLPDQKLKYIRKENKNNPVMMIGDGINDAPALALSTVGVSLGNASAQARESASAILVNNNLNQINKLLEIGKLTYQTIRQNLFWAFLYNIIAIPLAAAGFLSPTLAALGMAFSDLVVVGNSLRIRLSHKSSS